MLDVVNLRSMFSIHEPAEGSMEAPLTVVAEFQQKGLIRHIGLSNVTPLRSRKPSGSSRLSVYRITTTSCIEPMMRSSRISLTTVLRTCRSFRSVVLRHCSQQSCLISPRASALRRCRLHWPGFYIAHPTSC